MLTRFVVGFLVSLLGHGVFFFPNGNAYQQAQLPTSDRSLEISLVSQVPTPKPVKKITPLKPTEQADSDFVKPVEKVVEQQVEQSSDEFKQKSLVSSVKSETPVAQIIQQIPPKYPAMARRKGFEGTALIKVQVLSDGIVGTIKLMESTGYSVLDRAALKALKQWKFNPVRQGAQAITSWRVIPIRFSLTNA